MNGAGSIPRCCHHLEAAILLGYSVVQRSLLFVLRNSGRLTLPRDSVATIGCGANQELYLDAKLLSLGRPSMTIDEKVTELFVGLREPVYRYVITILGSAAEAEEITQEAFMRLYCHLRDGNTVDHSRAWVFRVAHNLAVNEAGRKRIFSPVVDWDELCAVRPDSGSSPEQTSIHEERFDQLQKAMGQLPELQRRCVMLRAEGFRYHEIASTLGLAKSTVQESLRRAMQKLRTYANV